MKELFTPAERKADERTTTVLNAALVVGLLAGLVAIILNPEDVFHRVQLMLGFTAMWVLHLRTQRMVRREAAHTNECRDAELRALAEIAVVERLKAEHTLDEAESRILAELDGKLVRIEHMHEREH